MISRNQKHAIRFFHVSKKSETMPLDRILRVGVGETYRSYKRHGCSGIYNAIGICVIGFSTLPSKVSFDDRKELGMMISSFG